MAELLSSLPGDIPGLLRRGSPVLIDFWRSEGHDDFPDEDSDERPEDYLCRGNVYEVEGDALFVAWSQSEAHEGGFDEIHRGWMALDLTDPTGRAHAAWWCDDRWAAGASTEDARMDDVLVHARHGADMTPTQIYLLARLVLRLAGRSHV